MDLEPLISRPTIGSAGITGSWRRYRPVIDKNLCNKCMNCYYYCPEGVISKDLEIDYTYCKGCGVCSEICKKGAIKMVPE